MGDFGIKVSQIGHDVQGAADFELLFSSGWPLLKIIAEIDVTITSDVTQTLYTHNLGYPPAFFLSDYSTGFSQSNTALNTANIGVNTTELKYFSGGFNTFPLTIHGYIFALDLTSNYLAPVVSSNPVRATTDAGDWGVKITKRGKDVSSKDYRDFTVHSGTQSPMIHQIVSTLGTSSNPGYTGSAIVSNHNLGYLPLFFSYVSNPALNNGYYAFTGNYTQSLPRVFGNTTFTQIELTSTAIGCLVVFKDPFNIDVPTAVINA